jgi:hypothetical protein
MNRLNMSILKNMYRWVSWYIPVIPALRGWRKQFASSKPAWAT